VLSFTGINDTVNITWLWISRNVAKREWITHK